MLIGIHSCLKVGYCWFVPLTADFKNIKTVNLFLIMGSPLLYLFEIALLHFILIVLCHKLNVILRHMACFRYFFYGFNNSCISEWNSSTYGLGFNFDFSISSINFSFSPSFVPGLTFSRIKSVPSLAPLSWHISRQSPRVLSAYRMALAVIVYILFPF